MAEGFFDRSIMLRWGVFQRYVACGMGEGVDEVESRKMMEEMDC